MLPNVSLSESQRKIVEQDGNVIVQAGAGTGKTHTLVSKIIYDIDRQRSHKVIAAITFTIKAAEEIKERLKLPPRSHFVGTNNRFVVEEIIQPFMKDVYGNDCNVKMSTDYSVKILSYDEGIRMIKEDHLLCTYKDNKYNFIFQLALAIVKQSAACQLYLKAKYFKVYVDEYQDCDTDMHNFFMYICKELGILLFVVGDVKQSIYMWRGAAPNLFISILSDPNFTCKELYENFRSCEQIRNYSYLLFSETSRLYTRNQDVSSIIVICASRENWAPALLPYIETGKSCAFIRRSNDDAKLSAESMRRLGLEVVYVTSPPVAKVGTNSAWLYNALAKFFIIQGYSVFDLIDEIPNDVLKNKVTVEHLEKLLSCLSESIEKGDQVGFISRVAPLAEYLDCETKTDHCKLLYQTILNKEYHSAFRVDSLKRLAMTVHSSKGLEFEQVVIFISDFNFKNEEEVHNHYVAVTRAKSKLIMVYIKPYAVPVTPQNNLIPILENSQVNIREVATVVDIDNV